MTAKQTQFKRILRPQQSPYNTVEFRNAHKIILRIQPVNFWCSKCITHRTNVPGSRFHQIMHINTASSQMSSFPPKKTHAFLANDPTNSPFCKAKFFKMFVKTLQLQKFHPPSNVCPSKSAGKHFLQP